MTIYGTLLETKRFAVHDGPGIRTAFYLKGCPLHCLWCHNPESISPKPEAGYYESRCIGCGECVEVCPQHAHSFVNDKHVFDRTNCTGCGKCADACLGNAMKLYGRRVSVDDALKAALEDRPFFEQSGGGVTLSGGEPLFQFEFTLAFLKALKQNGIHTALDTTLFAARSLIEQTLPFTDIYLVDFKHADPEEHERLTGQRNEVIRENLKFLSDAGAQIEIRIPFIPGKNASDENMHKTGQFLSQIKTSAVKLLPYHDLARSKYIAIGRPDTLPRETSPEEPVIQHACSILRGYGLNAHSGRE